MPPVFPVIQELLRNQKMSIQPRQRTFLFHTPDTQDWIIWSASYCDGRRVAITVYASIGDSWSRIDLISWPAFFFVIFGFAIYSSSSKIPGSVHPLFLMVLIISGSVLRSAFSFALNSGSSNNSRKHSLINSGS